MVIISTAHPVGLPVGVFGGVVAREAVGLRVAQCVDEAVRFYPPVRRAKTGV